MASDPLSHVRTQVGLRVAEIRDAECNLTPLDLYSRMDAIRRLAFEHGLSALEGLARRSAQLALLPGHRVALQTCLEHIEAALDSSSDRDRNAILAVLAVRLH